MARGRDRLGANVGRIDNKRTRMSQSEQPIEWYLARDGQRHGPISDLEMRKIVELGHLKPTDLVWRPGFPEWTTAASVFPAPPPRPAAPAPPAPVRPPASAPDDDPLRHRRVPPAGTTQRASPYGDVPQRPQPTGPGHAAHPQDPHAQAPHPGGPGPQAGYPHAPHPHHGPGGAAAELGARPQPGPAGDPHLHARSPDAHRAGRGAAPGPGGSDPHAYEEALAADLEEMLEPAQRRRMPWKLLISLLVLLVLAGAVIGLMRTGHLNLASLPFVKTSSTKGLPVVRAPKESYKESPLKTFTGSAEEIDVGFQRAAIWKLAKAEFPDWYKARVEETVKLKSENKDDAAISAHLMRALVDLRRKNANLAFAARPERLKAIATAFVETLSRLSKTSVEACYRFISGGETDPKMIELLRSSEHTATMQALMTSVLEAVVDGRKTQAKYAAAERKDYDLLAAQLSVRGWSPADLALFDDARSLSRAPHQKVCQMVQDWFSAQTSIKEEAVQSRLFVATLRPLIGE